MLEHMGLDSHPPVPSSPRPPAYEEVVTSPVLKVYLLDAPRLAPKEPPQVMVEADPPSLDEESEVHGKETTTLSKDPPPSMVKPKRLYTWNRPLPTDQVSAAAGEE